MEFKKKVLANGLTVLFEKRDVSVTTVMLAVKYGSGHDLIEDKGMAHFMEHLCFKGTEKRTVKQIVDEVEKVGGDLNAFTHEEITAYHVKLPSRHLNVAMDVIFDIFFNANFPKEEVEKEASVICEEIKMYHDNPRAHVMDNIKRNLYEGAFGMFGTGTEEIVCGMTRNKLFTRHRKMYVPGNSILCVVGNNNFEEIISFAKLLSPKSKVQSPKLMAPEIISRNIKSDEKRADLHQANVAIGFHFPGSNERARYAAEVFSAMLGQGMSSKLFSEVREKRGLVYGIKSDLDLGRDYGYMVIWAGTDPSNVDEVVKVCLKEFRKMGEVTQEELDEAKVQVVGNRDVESEGSNETAINLIMEEVAGNAQDYYEYEKKIGDVTLSDIRELASKTEYASFSLGP
jgi:predicted Zn-dependent peptidase